MSDLDPRPMLLDARGLKCPLPVLRAGRVIRGLPPGSLVEVLADDPAAPQDLASFCAATGHVVTAQEVMADQSRIVIRVKG